MSLLGAQLLEAGQLIASDPVRSVTNMVRYLHDPQHSSPDASPSACLVSVGQISSLTKAVTSLDREPPLEMDEYLKARSSLLEVCGATRGHS